MRLRGLTATREGRLVVIGLVGGTLMLVAGGLNVAAGRAADHTAGEVQRSLRRELSLVSDETLTGYPGTVGTIETMADRAIGSRPARLVGTARPDGEEIVVTVQSGWGWQVRCIRAELRGDATVLTEVTARPC